VIENGSGTLVVPPVLLTLVVLIVVLSVVMPVLSVVPPVEPLVVLVVALATRGIQQACVSLLVDRMNELARCYRENKPQTRTFLAALGRAKAGGTVRGTVSQSLNELTFSGYSIQVWIR
jgi:hypothetical protein